MFYTTNLLFFVFEIYVVINVGLYNIEKIMKILLTGATGYIGKRLLPVLIEQGHTVVCCVGIKNRYASDGIYNHPDISLFEIDFLKEFPSSELIKRY